MVCDATAIIYKASKISPALNHACCEVVFLWRGGKGSRMHKEIGAAVKGENSSELARSNIIRISGKWHMYEISPITLLFIDVVDVWLNIT